MLTKAAGTETITMTTTTAIPTTYVKFEWKTGQKLIILQDQCYYDGSHYEHICLLGDNVALILQFELFIRRRVFVGI